MDTQFREMSNQVGHWCRAGSIALMLIGWGTGAIAAEQVVWRYGILQGSLSVEELTQFAETGEASPAIQSHLELAGRNPQDVRETLNRKVTVDLTLVDRVLRSPVGNLVLNQLSQTIYTPSQLASREAMRAAFVLAASDDRQISLIELIQKYPTSEVYVDGDRLASAYRRIETLQSDVEEWLERRDWF